MAAILVIIAAILVIIHNKMAQSLKPAEQIFYEVVIGRGLGRKDAIDAIEGPYSLQCEMVLT